MDKYIITLSCDDTAGIVSSVSDFLYKNGCFILESSQFGDSFAGKFFMRIFFQSNEKLDYEKLNKNFEAVSKKFQMSWNIRNILDKVRTLIMVSKLDHCLTDLLYRWSNGSLNIEIPLVISNHDKVSKILKWYGIPFYHIPVSSENKLDQEDKIIKILEENKIDLIILARYMQILSPKLVSFVQGRAINIHHSFLPSFKGAKPYEQAYKEGVKIIGATAHYVTEDLDQGPIIEQEVTRVTHVHSPDDLRALSRDLESQVLYRAVKYHIESRVILNGNKTIVF